MNKNGRIVTDKEEKKETLKQYLEQLFYDTSHEVDPEIKEISGSNILKEEEEVDIKKRKQGKAVG